MGELVGVPIEVVVGRSAARAAPARLDGRAARGRVPADRRPRRPERADERIRGGATPSRRVLRRTRVTGARAGGRRLGARDDRRARSGRRSSSTRRASGRERSRGSPATSCRSSRCSTTTSSPSRWRRSAALARELPVLRDPDALVLRPPGGRRPAGRPVRARPEAVGAGRDPGGLPRPAPAARPRPDRGAARRGGRARAGVRRTPGIRTVVNGPDGYTPDGRCLMGPVPGLRNFHVLAGFSIFGIVFAGGAGRYAAEWIVDGQPSDNMWELDVRRFGGYATSKPYLVARASEVYEREYAIHYPEEERAGRAAAEDRPAVRPARRARRRLRRRGSAGSGRSGSRSDGPARDEYSFRRGNWFDAVGEECRAVRSGVGVLDQTSFAKYEVSGPGAEACSTGSARTGCRRSRAGWRSTQMLHAERRDRVRPDRHAARRGALLRRLRGGDRDARPRAGSRRTLPGDGSVRIENVTARYGVLTLAGPRSRELLQAADRSRRLARGVSVLPRARSSRSGRCRALALRVSYVGELGFELHHPLEYQRAALRAGCSRRASRSGSSTSATARSSRCGSRRPTGSGAPTCPRTGRRSRPGSSASSRFDKGDFVGREALLRQRERGVERSSRLPRRRRRRRRRARLRAGASRRHADRLRRRPAATATRVERVDRARLPAGRARRPRTELEVEILGEPRPRGRRRRSRSTTRRTTRLLS